jgi:hypothetical protein
VEAGPGTNDSTHLQSISRTVCHIAARFILKASTRRGIDELLRTSLDSHADTCCAGPNFTVLELTREKANVFPFSEKLSAVKDIPIATVAMIWEDPRIGEMWLLIIHEALYFGSSLQESLLCPNQLRAHGIKVDDTPVQFDPNSSHSIVVPDQLEIPLEMHGVASSFWMRLPTDEEIERYRDGELQSVELTADVPWEPYSSKFAEMEKAARASRATSAVQVTNPCSPTREDEEEEEEPETVHSP